MSYLGAFEVTFLRTSPKQRDRPLVPPNRGPNPDRVRDRVRDRTRTEIGQNPDRSRTESGPRPDRSRTEFGPRSDRRRTEFGPRPDRSRTEAGPSFGTEIENIIVFLHFLVLLRPQRRTERWTEDGPKLGQRRTEVGPSLGPDWTEAGPKIVRKWTEDGPKLDQRWRPKHGICDCFCFLLGQRSVNNFDPNSVQLRSKFGQISVQLRSNFETIPGPPGVQCLPDQIWKQMWN